MIEQEPFFREMSLPYLIAAIIGVAGLALTVVFLIVCSVRIRDIIAMRASIDECNDLSLYENKQINTKEFGGGGRNLSFVSALLGYKISLDDKYTAYPQYAKQATKARAQRKLLILFIIMGISGFVTAYSINPW